LKAQFVEISRGGQRSPTYFKFVYALTAYSFVLLCEEVLLYLLYYATNTHDGDLESQINSAQRKFLRCGCSQPDFSGQPFGDYCCHMAEPT